MELSARLLILNAILLLHVSDCRKFKIRHLAPTSSLSTKYLGFNKFIGIFGIKVVSHPSVCNSNLQYAANFLAQLIDCDEDGTPDDTSVIANLRLRKAILLLTGDTAKEKPKEDEKSHLIMMENCKTNDSRQLIMKSVLRYLTRFGIVPAYPGTLGTERRSFLRENLDIIVGDCGYAFDDSLKWPKCSGHVFYNERSCGITCMAMEYLIELIRTVIGIAPKSPAEGKLFWNIRNRTDLILHDSRGYSLIKQVLPWLPRKVPSGNYRPGRNGFKMAWYNGIPIKEKKQNRSWEIAREQLVEIAVS